MQCPKICISTRFLGNSFVKTISGIYILRTLRLIKPIILLSLRSHRDSVTVQRPRCICATVLWYKNTFSQSKQTMRQSLANLLQSHLTLIFLAVPLKDLLKPQTERSNNVLTRMPQLLKHSHLLQSTAEVDAEKYFS